MMLSRTLPTAVVLAALGAGGVALAQSSGTPRLASPPFLGRISGGAALRYDLTRTPGRQTVTITGFTNKQVRVVDISAAGAVQEVAGSVKIASGGYGITVVVPDGGQRPLRYRRAQPQNVLPMTKDAVSSSSIRIGCRTSR